MIKEGLYEQIINEEILENLNKLDKEKYIIDKEKLDNEILTLSTEASKNDTKYLEDNNILEKKEQEKTTLQRELLKVTEEKTRIEGEKNLLKERSKTTYKEFN